MARRDPNQMSLLDLLEPPPKASWWDAWKPGDRIPPGWKPPHKNGFDPDPKPWRSANPGNFGDPADQPYLEKLIRQHMANMLLKGHPSPIEEIHGVWWTDNAIVADIEVFDGGLHRFSVRDTRDTLQEYRWPGLTGSLSFGWDEDERRWRRYPEMRKTDLEAA